MIVYTTDSCPNCDVLKSKLKKADIPFEVKNAFDNLEYLQKKGYNSVPVTEVNGFLRNYEETVKFIELSVRVIK